MSRARSQRSCGCKTCRRRKVKCDSSPDEAWPKCERCQKAGIKCAGYSVEFQFVDESSRINAVVAAVSTQKSRSQNLPQRLSLQGSISRMDAAPVKHSGLNPQMHLKAFQHEIYISFLSQRLLQLPTQRQAFGHWMYAISREEAVNSPLFLSIQSLAASFYGRFHRQAAISAQGAQLYSLALGRVSQLLEDAQQCRSFEALACAAVLELYELVTYTVPFGWVRHAGGFGAVLEARGPWLHKDRFLRKIFQENRVNVVLHAILQRRRTFLEQQMWKEVPWEDDPTSKTQLDHLVDLLCDYPGLLEDVDSALNPGEVTQTNMLRWVDLHNRCHEKLEQLSKWHQHWVLAFSLCLREVDSSQSSQISIAAGGPLFPSILIFTDIWRAYEFCVHNALRILLLRVERQAYLKTAAKSRTDSADLTEIMVELATEICRSVDYFIIKHGSVGALLIMFPAQIALLALDPIADTAIWLKNVLIKIAEMDGLIIAKELLKGRCTDYAMS